MYYVNTFCPALNPADLRDEVHGTALVTPDYVLHGDAGFVETFGHGTVELKQMFSSELDLDIALVAIATVIRTGRAQKVQLRLVSKNSEWMDCTVGAIHVNGMVHLSFIVEQRGYILLDS